MQVPDGYEIGKEGVEVIHLGALSDYEYISFN